MRNGYKVYDTDTHIGATAETLDKYLSPRIRELVPDLSEKLVAVKTHVSGADRPEPKHLYRLGNAGRVGGWGSDVPRVLGEPEPRETAKRAYGKFQGDKWPNQGGDDGDVEARIHDMDEEGVDVHMMVNTGGPSGHPNPEVNIEFNRAMHRYIDDFCSKYPHRLKSMLGLDANYVEASVEEIHRWAKSSWARGAYINLPLEFPVDHPSLHPIWEALNAYGLAYIHHSFAVGYPGYRDLWSNPFMGRTASHPWGAMRSMAAFFGAGLMDRYPNLNYVILESGFGWIPFWATRMQDQAEYMGFVAEGLQHTMMEYTTSGRFYASIVLHEGGKMVKLVSDYVGDHLLMFSSDYPHPETRFPHSVDLALSWKDDVNPELMKKILWGNAVQCFGEP